MSKYEEMGVIFTKDSSESSDNNFAIHNLSMIVPAFLGDVVRNIQCVVRDSSFRQSHSGIVNIFVFKTFRK